LEVKICYARFIVANLDKIKKAIAILSIILEWRFKYDLFI